MGVRFRAVLMVSLISLLLGCNDGVSVDQHMNNARTYLENGENNAAMIELKNVLQQNNNNAEARFLLGQLYFNLEAYPDASKELGRAHELGTADEQVLPLLAQALLAQNEMEALQSLPTKNLTGNARAIVLAAKGWGELRVGQVEAATALIDQAVGEDPDSTYVLFVQAWLLVAQSTGDYEAVRRQLELVFQADPAYAPAWALLADIEQQSLQLVEAEADYSKAVSLKPNNFLYRYKLALVRIQLEDYEAAGEDVTLLQSQQPQHPGTHYLSGIIKSYKGDFAGAVTDFGVAAQYEDQFPLSLYYLAIAQVKTGKLVMADASASRFLAPEPDNISGRKLLAAIKLQSGDAVRAEELIRPVVVQNGEDIAALDLLGSSLIAQGKTDEGVEFFARVAELQPDSAGAQTRLGAGLMAAGDLAESLEHLETALELSPEVQQADLLMVSAHLRQRNYTAALEAIDAFEAKEPRGNTASIMRGTVHLRAGSTAEAEKAFARALEISPGNPTANHALAMLAMQAGNYERANGYYQAVLEVNENHLPTLLKMAALAERHNDYPGMLKILEQSVSAHPMAVQPKVLLARYYLVQGKPDQVVLVLSDLDESANLNPDVVNVLGLAQLQQGEYFDAKASFDDLIGLRPDAPQPHYNLGMAYRGLGDTTRMTAQFEKAIEISSAYVQPRIELTRVLLQKKDREAAVAQLAILRQLAPENAEVIQLEAVRARLDGDYVEALKLSELAFQRSPTTRNLLVLTRQQWEQGEQKAALHTIESWLEQHPGDTGARLELATMYLSKGDSKQAEAQYMSVLEIDQDSWVALNNLAWQLRDSAPTQALAYAERAVSLNRESSAVLDTLAVVQLKNGELAKAERSIARALDLKPTDPSMRYHSVMISSAAGNREEAIAALEALLAEEEAFSERSQAEKLLQELQ